jgi:hypothetical protein
VHHGREDVGYFGPVSAPHQRFVDRAIHGRDMDFTPGLDNS